MTKIYKHKDFGYVLELWAASTKHPDSVFCFSDFEKSGYIKDKYQVFQWLLECASRLSWPHYAKELTEYTLKEWYPDKDWEEPELEIRY